MDNDDSRRRVDFGRVAIAMQQAFRANSAYAGLALLYRHEREFGNR
jgi:hypothetical protein